jgi:hypothetical protein
MGLARVAWLLVLIGCSKHAETSEFRHRAEKGRSNAAPLPFGGGPQQNFHHT